MSNPDVEFVRDYADPIFLSDQLQEASRFTELSLEPEEADVLAQQLSRMRAPFVIKALRQGIESRHTWLDNLREAMGSHDVLYIEDWVPETSLTEDEDLRQALDSSGNFIGYVDFKNVQQEARTTHEYITNLFHTLVLFFLEGNHEGYQRAEAHLRYQAQNHSFWNMYAPTYRYFLRAEALLPFAAEKVYAENKIPGVGRIGRKVLRLVLFDDEDIDVKMAQERARFDI